MTCFLGHPEPNLFINESLKHAHDILSSLPSSPSPLVAKDSVPLLLVTPSFAHWLNPSDGFLPGLMSKLYGNVPNASALYTVAAIVDMIPNISPPLDNDECARRLESEGLSLLVVDKENLQGKALLPSRFGGPANEGSDLLVSIQSPSTNQSLASFTHEVGLRLANTVFINGKESTLFGVQWTRDDTTNEYTVEGTVDLTSCVVTSTSSSTGASPRLALPLYPIGERRKVIASMGNILRQISKSVDPTSTEGIPASRELEKDLPRYIKENNIMDQRVSVWALVEKPDVVVADRNLPTQEYLMQSLRQGGKLHRVVSGGGGWGKKQGLLSLDPEISFSASACRDGLVGLDQLFQPRADAELGLPPFITKGPTSGDLSLLSQVATAGDFIQFFVAVDPACVQKSDAVPSDGNIMYRFGMVSNAEEVYPSDATNSRNKVTVVPNSFGALSEKAIGYTQPVAQGGETSESSTKLDIPGCRVILNSV